MKRFPFAQTLWMLCCLAFFSCSSSEEQNDPNHILYYTTPAAIWEETLPLGNGRLGMMPDGGIACERIVLNEISMWSGSESDYRNPDAAESLPRIRQLLFEGKNREAQELMYSSFVPKKQETDGRYGSFQTLGMLEIDFPELDAAVDNYHRALNLRDAVATTSFMHDHATYHREYFVSREADVMVVHLTTSEAGALSFTARVSREADASVTTDGNILLMQGQLPSGNPDKEGMKYRVAMRLIAPSGKIAISAQHGISLQDGQEAWLLLSAATNFQAAGTTFPGEAYVSVCDSLLQQEIPSKAAHIAAHRDLYDRVSITLPATPNDTLPTNERILRFVEEDSPALATLYYNYGRYLLIGSTRPGSLPPNLQGLWGNTLWTPWNGDYHTNINVQMNHWPLEQAGLSELYQPLTTLVERLIPSGRESARCFYGEEAEGWVLHMMTNVWNYTAPGEHPSWGATNTGGAWLCAHLWEHFEYNRDMDYLRRIYPILKGASAFFHSTIVEEPAHGWLVTAPTSSPENCFYVGSDKTPVSICMGPTMDVQLLTELFRNVIEATRLLNCDADYAAQLQADLEKFPPMQISEKGYLQEWLEDYEEQDVHHRHVSHLYGLHPANLISPETTPELAAACRETLERRGDGGTGWSRAWKINFWARLRDGNRALKLFKSLLYPAIDAQSGHHGSGTFPNLFCSHPPFQIDGNYGGAAGIAEMLLQSQAGFIDLLPALPDSWSEGNFRGMRVRGGAMIDLEWSAGKAQKATITALRDGVFRLKMPQGASRAEVRVNGKKQVMLEEMMQLTLQVGDTCEISFE